MAASIVPNTTQASATLPLSTQLSDQPDEVDFDPIALKAKYAAEGEKRLHQDGGKQYRPMDCSFSSDMKHKYDFILNRDSVDLNCDVVIIGGGYGGQLVPARLIEQGVNNLSIIEKGGDFGGTWSVLEVSLYYLQLILCILGTGTDILGRNAILNLIYKCLF